MRSVSAAMRAAERDAERRRKAERKAEEAELAEQAVAEWKDLLRTIVTIHTDKADDIDWQALATKNEPEAPLASTARQEQVKAKLTEFTPGKLDFLFGGTSKRIARLEAELADATTEDEAETQARNSAFEQAVLEWREDRDLATRVLGHDGSAFSEVLTELYSGDHSLIARTITFQFADSRLHAVIDVADEEKIVPNFRRKQLQSGKLSQTKMPKGEYFELYQDYVCSCALRVAGDVFGVLPVDDCYVTCRSKMLDTATGHLAETPILSVFFVRETFDVLNLAALDPSDSMSNFNHAMSFKRTKGLERIDPLVGLEG